MREMLYAEWTVMRMPFMQMTVRVCAAALFGMLLAGSVMLCMMVVLPAVLVLRMLCDAALLPGWEAYSLTLPAGRRTAAASRFVVVLCCNAAATVICMTAIAVCRLATGMVGQLQNDGAVLLVCIAWAMAASGLMLAVSDKWGLKQANFLLLGGIGVLYLIIAVVRRTEAFSRVWHAWSGMLAERLSGRVLAAGGLLAIVGCAVFLLCCLWSVHSYVQKEL